MNTHKLKNNKGYALLFTVVIISIILTISIGMANAVYKEILLSSVAKDSQAAFYQADTGTECGLYFQLVANVGVPGSDPNGNPTITYTYGNGDTFECGMDAAGNPMGLTVSIPSPDIIDLTPSPDIADACFYLHFDDTKTAAANRLIESRGYNNCDQANPRTVERVIEVEY